MTVALVANIALPISSALSTAFSTDAVGKMDAYGKIGASSPAWSPLSLFAASEVGAWYDPSDLITMFQDAAGTTPVTADGQRVGLIQDKSGNGNHASQATAAKRPLYKTDGTYHWLQFDGVDDGLGTAAIDFTATDKASVFAGVRKANTIAAPNILFETEGAPRNFGIFAPDPNNSNYAFWIKNESRPTFQNYASPITNVLSVTHDCSGATAILQTKPRINQAAVPFDVAAAVAAGNFSSQPLYVGARANSASYLTGNIYSLIIRGALSTTDEITDAETWVNSKTGAF